jgi:hypothetical protein
VYFQSQQRSHHSLILAYSVAKGWIAIGEPEPLDWLRHRQQVIDAAAALRPAHEKKWRRIALTHRGGSNNGDFQA